MSDLRERLIAALHNAYCGCDDTPTHFAAQYTPQADAALAEVASWLRERADQLMPVLFTPRQLLGILADEISPTHDSESAAP